MNLHREFLKNTHLSISNWIYNPNDFCDIVFRYIRENYPYLNIQIGLVVPTNGTLKPQLSCFMSKRFEWHSHKIHIIDGYVHSMFVSDPMRLDRYIYEVFKDQTVSICMDDRDELWVGGTRVM